MYIFVGFVGIIGFIISFILLVLAAIRKRNKKKPLIGLIIFFLLFVIALIITPISDTSSTTTPPSTQTSEEEISEEEISEEEKKIAKDEASAQKLKDQSKDSFDDGMYDTAFSKCDKILADYPSTAVAATIPDFLKELYNSAINIAATDLRDEYDANEVNADTVYKNKTVVVTGTVTAIGKDLGGTSYITIDDGSPYGITSVQCYFKDDKVESVGAISKGNSIKILGKCYGNSINILIKNCYIIE